MRLAIPEAIIGLSKTLGGPDGGTKDLPTF